MNKIVTRPLSDIYMHVSSGKKYYPFAPKPEDVCIDVIAHHLATRARWNGATQHKMNEDLIFYSVAEHSVYVSEYVEYVLQRPDLAMEALLHDASEAYNGDLIRPLKYSAEFAEPFRKVEDINEKAIAKKFNLPWPMSPEVKIGDEAVCNAEFEQIIPRSPEQDWSLGTMHDTENTAQNEIQMLLPKQARDFFMGRFWSVLKLHGRTGKSA